MTFFLGLFRTVRIKVSEVFTMTCLVSTVITLKLLNLICKWISEPKWNCHLYTISALFHCRTGFASAAASPSESANEQLPEKESASKIKTARRSRISTSSPPACVFSCHYLVPVIRVSRFSAGQQTAHVELFIFYWTALLAETYTLYEPSQQRLRSHSQESCTVSELSQTSSFRPGSTERTQDKTLKNLRNKCAKTL